MPPTGGGKQKACASVIKLDDADKRYPWRGICSVSNAECGTDVGSPTAQTWGAIASQGRDMTIFQ
jgi:hypothetical protein